MQLHAHCITAFIIGPLDLRPLSGLPKGMAKLKVFIADDHPIMRVGFKTVLNSQPDMKVVGECSDGAALVDSVVTSKADVVLVDVHLPPVSGARLIEQIRINTPDAKVVALCVKAKRYDEAVLAAGATGFIVKRTPPDELAHAVRRVGRGETFIDPRVVEARATAANEPTFSARELAALRGVARGLTMKEIAAALDVGARTVETYRERAMAKAKLRTRADVIRFAAERGWLLDE
jgi:two-component system response regulator NreC